MQNPMQYDVPFARSIDPSFKDYVSPIEARRMGKILKRAVATSKDALKAASLESVDAIITGTGYGCIENTEFFLDALSNEGEQLLKPTYFMQSTHNTISSLVAIQTKNHGYNVTYAHKGISFDSALQDAWWQFQLGKIDSALVGGHDEMTETFYHILKKGGVMGQDEEMCGEAAVSVVLASVSHCEERSNPEIKPLCKLTGFTLLHQPTMNTIKEAVSTLLQSAGNSRYSRSSKRSFIRCSSGASYRRRTDSCTAFGSCIRTSVMLHNLFSQPTQRQEQYRYDSSCRYGHISSI